MLLFLFFFFMSPHIAPLPPSSISTLCSLKRARNPGPKPAGRMLAKTRTMLRKFYSSHLLNLAEIMGNGKFLWWKGKNKWQRKLFLLVQGKKQGGHTSQCKRSNFLWLQFLRKAINVATVLWIVIGRMNSKQIQEVDVDVVRDWFLYCYSSGSCETLDPL